MQRISFGFLGWFCILVMSTVVLAQPATQPSSKPAIKPVKAPPPPRTPESAVTEASRRIGRHKQFLERIQQGPIGLLFFGDSITDFWPKKGADTWAKFEPYQPADFGISGEHTENILWGLSHGEVDGISPKVVVVMIGTNNIGHFDDEKPEWVTAGITKIVKTLHEKLPKSKVLLLAIFPRDKKGSARQLKVNEVNASIAKLADDNTTFLDIGKHFLKDDGEVDKDLMPDLLHPNDKGYQVWYDAMWPTLEKMLK